MNSDRAPLLKWSPTTWQRWGAMPRLSTTPVPRTPFFLLKAPVSTLYEEKFGDRNVFTVPMYMQRLIAKGIAIGLVIDCTALDLALFDPATIESSESSDATPSTTSTTKRYFNNVNEWDEFGVDYYQLVQDKNTSVPSSVTIVEFINVCTQHMKEHPTMKIALYDARGSNGVASFLVAYYLCHRLKAPVQTALDLVAKASPTSNYSLKGLYDVELIKELQRIFCGKKEISVDCTKIPKWWFGDSNTTDESDMSDEKTVVIPPFQNTKRQHDAISDSSSKRSRSDKPNLPFQELPSSSQRYIRAMTVMKQLTRQEEDIVPIRDEVILSMENISQLNSGKYQVTWRSVGRRGLLLILSDGIYFLENVKTERGESNGNSKGTKATVSALNTPLYIPSPQKPTTVQHRTLLDVTLVMDREKERIVPRFLVTDILSHMGGMLVHKPFHQRLKYMMDGVIMARKKSVNIWKYDKEGIKMRAREYFDINKTEFLIKQVMERQLHDSDGAIFVPSDSKYGGSKSFVVEKKDESMVSSVIDHTKN